MPEAAVVDAPKTDTSAGNGTSTTSQESLGWRAGLPDDLKTNADLANFKTVGDFAKSALETQGKVKRLETQLAGSIPKLPDNATDDDRAVYYDALGRPKQASEYEFDGEDKNAPEWTNLWKSEFHSLGLTKEQAKQLSSKWNAQMTAMVKAHNDTIAKETADAQSKLKTELGVSYDTSVELAKRLWQKHGDTEFDKVFADGTGANRFTMIRFLLKMASLTGEDTSPQAGHSSTAKVPTDKEGWMNMYKNPVKR